MRWIVVVCGCCDVWSLGDNDVLCDTTCDEVGIVVGNDVELLNCTARKKTSLTTSINIYLVYSVHCHTLCSSYRWNFHSNFIFLNPCYIPLEKVLNTYLDNKKFLFHFVYSLTMLTLQKNTLNPLAGYLIFSAMTASFIAHLNHHRNHKITLF